MQTQTRKENWDYFWGLNRKSRFTQKSWSKIRIMKLLDRLLHPGMAVLDAGCGSGFFSNYFLSRGCRVHTLDYSETALEVARLVTENRSESYLQENLLDPSFGDRCKEKFDLIFTDGLFEHFSDADQKIILNNFKKTKTHGGTIATFVPNRYSWWEIVRPLVMPGIQEVPFTMKKLEALHSGLEIFKTGGLNVLPLPFSPDQGLGRSCGMLLYCFAR